MMMLKVKLGKDALVMLYGKPIAADSVVEVPDTPFYRRRIADGSLVRAVDAKRPEHPQVRKAETRKDD